MKLLVTGGAGYIGSVVTRMLLDAGHQVVVLDDLRTGHREASPRTPPTSTRPVHDAARVLTPDAGFDGVLHFAALIAAGESMVRPELYWHNNTSARCACIDAVRAAGVPRMVFSSTAAVYGNPAELPIPETAVKAPTNTYGGDQARRRHGAHLRGVGARAGRRVAALLQRRRGVPARRRRPSASGTTRRRTSSRSPCRWPPAGGRSSSCSATTTPPSTAPACATTSTSSDLAARAPAGAGRGQAGPSTASTTWATATASPTGRSSTWSARSPAQPVPVEVAPRREGDPAELVASVRDGPRRAGLGAGQADPARHGRRRLGVPSADVAGCSPRARRSGRSPDPASSLASAPTGRFRVSRPRRSCRRRRCGWWSRR